MRSFCKTKAEFDDVNPLMPLASICCVRRMYLAPPSIASFRLDPESTSTVEDLDAPENRKVANACDGQAMSSSSATASGNPGDRSFRVNSRISLACTQTALLKAVPANTHTANSGERSSGRMGMRPKRATRELETRFRTWPRNPSSGVPTSNYVIVSNQWCYGGYFCSKT